MLSDLAQLMAHAEPQLSVPDYRRLVVQENILGKPTRTTREHTIRKLKALYGLEPGIPVFRNMVRLWRVDEASTPLLAMLCAHARDPLLRIASNAVVGAALGEIVAPETIQAVVEAKAPGRFSPTNLRAISVRVLSSFTQSGHLVGNLTKIRQQAAGTPVNAAYAAFLAFLEGYRAQRILSSPWAALLDTGHDTTADFLREAGRRGLINFRQSGDVFDVGFGDWLTPGEMELAREQA